MAKVWERRPFEYTEIDVMAPKQDKWKALYEFDTPVVWPSAIMDARSRWVAPTDEDRFMLIRHERTATTSRRPSKPPNSCIGSQSSSWRSSWTMR